MAGFLVGVAIFFVVLAVIAVVGHGLWVLAAMIFGGRSRRKKDLRQCVFCGRTTPRLEGRCDWCGRNSLGPLAEELSDLQAVERQLKRFGESGELKPKVVKDLLARVVRYRAPLVEPLSPRPAAAPGSPFVAPLPLKKQPAEGPIEVIDAEVVEEAPAKPRAAKPKPQAAKPQAVPVVVPQVAIAVKPKVPRRSWSEMMAAFMEERNIRWGELMGGC